MVSMFDVIWDYSAVDDADDAGSGIADAGSGIANVDDAGSTGSDGGDMIEVDDTSEDGPISFFCARAAGAAALVPKKNEKKRKRTNGPSSLVHMVHFDHAPVTTRATGVVHICDAASRVCDAASRVIGIVDSGIVPYNIEHRDHRSPCACPVPYVEICCWSAAAVNCCGLTTVVLCRLCRVTYLKMGF